MNTNYEKTFNHIQEEVNKKFYDKYVSYSKSYNPIALSGEDEQSQKNSSTIDDFLDIESESLRVIEILKILPKLKKWTPVSKIAETINSKVPSTLWAVQKLAGALRIDFKTIDGEKTIVKRPILLVQKKQFNTRNNLKKYKYLRPTVSVKGHFL